MTYPEQRVIDYISEHFVPTKLLGAEHRDLTKAFNVRWFPALVVADAKGRATHQQIGFLPPDDLISELDYGRAIHAMTTKQYGVANALFQRLSDATGAERAPEAAYWWGLAKMATSRGQKLTQAHGAVQASPARWSRTMPNAATIAMTRNEPPAPNINARCVPCPSARAPRMRRCEASPNSPTAPSNASRAIP